MKRICFVLFIVFYSLQLYSQKLFDLEELAVPCYYGDTKFENARKFAIGALSRSQQLDYTIPKTVWVLDIVPNATLYIKKRIDILIGLGFEAHKIRNDFRPEIAESIGVSDKYKKYKTNLLYKLAAGSQFHLIGSRYKMINLRLNIIFTFEGFIKNNTRNYIALGPFGFPTHVDDYAGNPIRLGLDLMPLVNINLSQLYSINFGAGYSFGLNNSNRRMAVFNDGSSQSSLVIFDRKESTFIFQIGISYNLSKTKRSSLKKINFSSIQEKINISN